MTDCRPKSPPTRKRSFSPVRTVVLSIFASWTLGAVHGCGCEYKRVADLSVVPAAACLSVASATETITCCGDCDDPVRLEITNRCAETLTLARRCRTRSDPPATFPPGTEASSLEVRVNEADCTYEGAGFFLDGLLGTTPLTVSFRLVYTTR